MEAEVPGPVPPAAAADDRMESKEPVRVKRKTLQAVLEQCQRALESLSNDQDLDDDDDEREEEEDDGAGSDASLSRQSSGALQDDTEADEFCDLLKSRVECPDFLEKIESAQVPVPQNSTEEGSSWDLVNDSDLWDSEKLDADKEDYVLVRQEDIVEGIACFMAAYLSSLKETKACALSKTFSAKKKKGKLRKAWDGSKVIYNVASWGATAIGYDVFELLPHMPGISLLL
ncbi:hypothetical protein CDL15_Pgr019228 [Punica granatum]|uniref:Uncharacterized protein n=1 Tax=Punica granatum TaxID=22663 RepID=A0A218W4F1_PUNGR|nr:hypothetical protein CDL15_Pgr019228 [Punica granatum]